MLAFEDLVRKECKLIVKHEVQLRPEISSDQRRMDVVVDSFPVFGQSLWVDFGVTCPVPEVFRAGTHLSRTVEAGVACASYASSKLGTYSDLIAPSVRFTPTIVDIYGYWHEPFVHLIRELATAAASRAIRGQGQDEPTILQAASARLINRWMQRLSIILQRARTGRADPPTGRK